MDGSGQTNFGQPKGVIASGQKKKAKKVDVTKWIKKQQAAERTKRRKFEIKKLKFRKVKTWVLIVILIPLLFVDATLLRLSHIRMTELRDAVLVADESEDDEAIAAALEELRDYTFSHIVINVVEENGQQRVMFGTGPFYLEHQYRRKATEALEEWEAMTANDSNPNGNIYKAASDVCSPQAIANGWAWDSSQYINCMMGELQKYPEAEDLNMQIEAVLPSTELFRMNYAAPVWAPTLTGFCLLITLILMIVIVVRMVVWIVLQISLLFI